MKFLKKLTLLSTLFVLASSCGAVTSHANDGGLPPNMTPPVQIYVPKSMHRLYNPNSGEHFYTAATYERDVLINLGWHGEGIGWETYMGFGDAVYRLYNPNAGDHHYTKSSHERDYLIKVGWRDEGIGWYSNGEVPVYRLYNPNAKKAGAHHYTTSSHERDFLVKVGWRDEGIGWYAVR